MIHNEIIDAMLNRRSCLDYLDKPVSDEVVETLLTAGRYAPTSGGRQPWHFTAVRDPKNLDMLCDLVYSNYKSFAKNGPPKNSSPNAAPKVLPKTPLYPENPVPADIRHHAPLIIIVSGNKSLSSNNYIDCCLATENMYIAAESLGLSSLWWGALVQGGFSKPEAAEVKKLLMPEGFEVVSASLFGYPDPDGQHEPGRVVGFVRGSGGVTYM